MPVSRAGELGVVLVPADRSTEGLIAEMSIAENLSLSVLDRLTRMRRLSSSKEDNLVSLWLKRLEVVSGSPEDPITTLSGGNQQKVLIGRCLASEPSMLVLSEPTAGVDVGARRTIYDFIAEQTKQGVSVLVASSDIGDLVAMCTRILVLHDGKVTREIQGDEIDEHAIVMAIEGVPSTTDRSKIEEVNSHEPT
jgi:ribose transport system ATP-binding protein